MEARKSSHLDACVERRRDALMGRRAMGVERGGKGMCSAARG